MRERPILFSAPMVRALLAGAKTQTRRALRDQNPVDLGAFLDGAHLSRRPVLDKVAQAVVGHRHAPVRCPYGKPGDQLWVREAWSFAGTLDPGVLVYRADYPACVPPHYENVPPATALKWRPSIHLGRDQSRITLEVTEVRVERLLDISKADAIAEGITFCQRLQGWHVENGTHFHCVNPRESYWSLWESINGPDSWAANPFVWAITFRRLQ